MTRSSDTPSVRRRGVLGALVAGAAGSGGCLRRVRAIAGWQSTAQVSLEIKTLPADADPYALRVARSIRQWYRAAGIDAQVTPMAEEELLRQVLLNNDFDVFVARADRFRDPDTLYALLHSQFAEASGWQNPFGFADLGVDELLDAQRRTTGEHRREILAELQRTVARRQPFSVVAFPDDIRAARGSNVRGWRAVDLRSPLGYLQLDRSGGNSDGSGGGDGDAESGGRDLRMASTDHHPTENLNPLSVEYRRRSVFPDLLYDSLGYGADDGAAAPWLADSWAFSESGGKPRATVRLRPDLRWHDGEPLTAADVAFTYALLADTSLESTGSEEGNGQATADAGIPAPRFQGRSGLVADARAQDSRTVEFQFVECTPRIATRAFTVPVLPEHVWADRTGTASVVGIEFGSATEALVTDNIPPVGSGPLRFVRNTPREELILKPFEGHFLVREPGSGSGTGTGLPSEVRDASGFAFDRLAVRVVGSDTTAIEMVANDEADLTGTPVGAGTVPRIGRVSDLELLVSRSAAPYLVGYNARRPPLTNPRFRKTLARLIDQIHLVDRVFDGYAAPAVSPLAETDWVPADLRWDAGDPVTPFFGAAGEVDVDRARDAFRDAGFQYDGADLVTGD
jgi:peptide/nickel transport system substrate-binding protein